MGELRHSAEARFAALLAREAPRFIHAAADQIDAEIVSMLGAIGELYDLKHCIVYLVNDARDRVTRAMAWWAPGVPEPREGNPTPQQFRAVEAMIKAGRAMVYPDVSALPPDLPERHALDSLGVGSAAAAPFDVPDGPSGFITMQRATAGLDPSAGELQHLQLTGEVVAYAIVRRNEIRQRELAEERVRRLNEELERRVLERTEELAEANRALESFGYSLTHDLRAPLRHIDGYLQLLLSEYAAALPDGAHAHLDKIAQARLRMKNLVEDMATLAGIARRALDVRDVDVSALAHEVVTELERDREVAVVVEPEICVRGDAGLVRIALENLLRNAWKFSRDQAAPRIEVGATARGWFVRDNGIGFPPERAQDLFEPFVRLHPHDEFEGTGIGLATVARIVKRHRGRVRAESAPGEGATFFVSLGL